MATSFVTAADGHGGTLITEAAQTANQWCRLPRRTRGESTCVRLTKDEVRWIAANIAKLPELMSKAVLPRRAITRDIDLDQSLRTRPERDCFV